MGTIAESQTFVNALSEIQASGPIFDMLKNFSDGIMAEPTIMKALIAKGKTTANGARDIVYTIDKEERQATPFTRGTPLTASRPEQTVSLSVPMAHYVHSVAYDYLDFKENKGDTIENYVKFIIEKLRREFLTTLTYAVFGDGTTMADGTVPTVQPIIGLALNVADTATSGTVGGQTRSSSTTWLNNQSINITSLNALTTSNLMDLKMRCSHGGLTPNYCFCADEAYLKIWNIAKAENWLRNNAAATELGFPENIDFHGIPIIHDKHISDDAVGGKLTSEKTRIYMLTIGPEALQLRVDATDEFKMHEIIPSENQLAYIQRMTWGGQLICKSFRNQGVIYWS